jgi:hypothetical protein
MSNLLFEHLFISVSIDVGADFSFMSIAPPNQTSQKIAQTFTLEKCIMIALILKRLP